jgi:hypothetical protein
MMNQIFNGEELDQEALFHPFSDNDSDISDDSMEIPRRKGSSTC